MIVYMIQDNQTGNWFGFDHSWHVMQEHGGVWANERDTNATLRSISKPNNAVKMRFAIAPVIEGAELPDIVVVDGETWSYDPDFSTWFWGTANDGCGVQTRRLDAYWTANVVVNGDINMLESYKTRDEAMIAAVKYWKERQ